MKYIPISKVAHKYLYLAPGVTSTNILSIVHTYYSKYLYSVHLYYSTLVLEYLYLPGKSSTGVPTTIIGLLKTRVFILISFISKSFIVQLYKTREEFKPTNKNKMF